jgi:hypothetical protein
MEYQEILYWVLALSTFKVFFQNFFFTNSGSAIYDSSCAGI